MKKKILIAVLIIVALPFVTALFVNNQYSVSRSVLISKPKDEVFTYLKHLRNQDNFNKWVLMDPEMKKSFRGTDGTVGSVYAWDGEKAGKGEQEITAITEGEAIALELRFEKPFKSTGHSALKTSPVADGTQVEWSMSGESPYPFNFMNLFMDGMLGADLDESLNLLKTELEK